MKPTDLPPKLAAKIRLDAEAGCWIWTGAFQSGRYGIAVWPPGSKKQHYAHRLVWQLLKEPVPDGMVLDHLCRVSACVNPLHLEIVTHAENARRVGGNPNTKGFCRNGHPWTSANISIRPNGARLCRECKRERSRRRTAAGGHRKARPGMGQASLPGT